METHTQAFFEREKRGRDRVKHNMVRRILGAFFAIFGFYRKVPVVYVDGFAGPGFYRSEDGSSSCPGSPIVAYRTAAEHKYLHRFQAPSIQLIFVEKDPARAEMLRAALQNEELKYGDAVREKVKFCVYTGEFAHVLEFKIMTDSAFQRSPMLVFADPFGYSGKYLPMKLLQRLCNRKDNAGNRVPTELFVNLMDSFVNRFISDTRRGSCITELMGDAWSWLFLSIDENGLNPDQRRQEFIQLYMNNMKAEIPNCNSLAFSIRDQKNIHRYHLVFFTTDDKGLKIMKEVMYSQSQKADSMVFSEFDEAKGRVLPKDKAEMALRVRDLLLEHYAGNTVSGTQISTFLLKKSKYTLNFVLLLKPHLKEFKINDESCFINMMYQFPGASQVQVLLETTQAPSNHGPVAVEHENPGIENQEPGSSSGKRSGSTGAVNLATIPRQKAAKKRPCTNETQTSERAVNQKSAKTSVPSETTKRPGITETISLVANLKTVKKRTAAADPGTLKQKPAKKRRGPNTSVTSGSPLRQASILEFFQRKNQRIAETEAERKAATVDSTPQCVQSLCSGVEMELSMESSSQILANDADPE